MAANNTTAFAPLAAFTFNSTTPFGTFAEDLATDAFEQAHALTLILNNVITEAVADGNDMPIRLVHLGQAVSGIMTLMELAAFAREATETKD